MAERQKPWDQYEAVVLLEGFLDILSNNFSRNEVIDRVSHDLRTMAINQGYEIDDIFRNKNGITFQMKSMESAYLGYTVVKPASRLFTETVALYRNSPSEYEKMRKEAREMIEGNKEKKFMDYLASQVSHALFVELSSFYPDIEAFCLKLNVLKKPLFETTDFETIKRVQKTIEQNKIFKITRRKNYAKIVAACRYYYVYVREGLFDNGNPMDAPSKAVQSIPSVATTTDASNITEQPVTDSVKPDISSNSPTSSTEPKILCLEEMVREALRAETEGNYYGTTVSFLQGHIRGGDREKIRAILDNAEWAKFQFGRYYYVSKEAPVSEARDRAAVAPDNPAMPIERTESDKRLLQKYPIIYKRLFSSLLELTETHPKGVSVSELYAHINRVGRPSVIEEILDNVSWATMDGNNYILSQEVVDHSSAVEDAINTEADTVALISENFTDEAMLVDFTGSNDLAYTRPLCFTYFEEEKVVNSWTDLYVSFFATIQEDYPHIFRAGMSFSRNNGRIDLMQANDADAMLAPKPVPGTSYVLETNLSASDIVGKIKSILDLCSVDFDNIVIKYRKKDSTPRSKQSEPIQNQDSLVVSAPAGNVAFDAFLAYLQRTLQMAERTAYNYAISIGVCETIAKEQGYDNWHLYSEDANAVLSTIGQLRNDAVFIEKNRSRHNQLSAALAKLVQFINGGRTDHTACEQAPAKTVEPYQNKPYAAVLENHFKKGFRLESPLEIRKFRRYYSALHNVELTDADEVIADTIKRLCIIYDGKAFLPAVMLSEELKEKLLRYIDESFATGKTAIYYQAIYTEFAEEFLDYHIYDAEMLKAYLAFVSDGHFYINRSSISKQANVTLDPLSEIRSCLQGYGRPVEYEELFAALPHLPQSKVKFILASNGEFVNNGRGEYFHESVIVLSEEELDNIADIISYTIEEKEFIGGNELYDAIKAKYPYIIESNQAYSVYGFRDALKYKLGDRFSFKGNIISRAGQELSMADVFANYAKHHDSFTLTELQAMAAELATVIYFDSVYKNSLRISREQFVSKSHAQFSIADTDAAIDRVCTGNYIPIQEVTNFGAFPYAGFPWNSYLLEHYAAEYSRKYMLLHSSYNGTEPAGAIVKRSAGIQTFDDLIIDLLANNDVELKKASALQYLSDKGYLARRRYANIESLIIKATAQRNRKDTD